MAKEEAQLLKRHLSMQNMFFNMKIYLDTIKKGCSFAPLS